MERVTGRKDGQQHKQGELMKEKHLTEAQITHLGALSLDCVPWTLKTIARASKKNVNFATFEGLRKRKLVRVRVEATRSNRYALTQLGLKVVKLMKSTKKGKK
jgi:hypothetical protein